MGRIINGGSHNSGTEDTGANAERRATVMVVVMMTTVVESRARTRRQAERKHRRNGERKNLLHFCFSFLVSQKRRKL
jgi:hypothetical protein